ncbi:unnamed protein product [Amoebophrya sp. A120]|nr:unnamed protein product [Amoebophrya sp. A120]|eukprot:GSA120T00025540001.1
MEPETGIFVGILYVLFGMALWWMHEEKKKRDQKDRDQERVNNSQRIHNANTDHKIDCVRDTGEENRLQIMGLRRWRSESYYQVFHSFTDLEVKRKLENLGLDETKSKEEVANLLFPPNGAKFPRPLHDLCGRLDRTGHLYKPSMTSSKNLQMLFVGIQLGVEIPLPAGVQKSASQPRQDILYK